MRITKEMVGKRVKGKTWEQWQTITAVGEHCFLVIDHSSIEWNYSCDGDWIIGEPKKRMAPALYRGFADVICISGEMYESEAEARNLLREKRLICWPAPVPDKDGYYEVPEGK